ncbi:hypothetical protein [Variovorax sp. dw_954]|uniref:hypothetical protein n=1 Tax=Variovorax sp. dw_954 TaxID=2720078 RepID=UPI001BD43B82|nr:hypothetical protein [Variovorax sp. dw_954]
MSRFFGVDVAKALPSVRIFSFTGGVKVEHVPLAEPGPALDAGLIDQGASCLHRALRSLASAGRTDVRSSASPVGVLPSRKRGTETSIKGPVAAVAIGLCLASANAQQSVTSDLDSCINSEKISLTAQGALAGVATGVLTSFMVGKKQDMGKAAVIGGVAGGALGYATAYYKAAGKCMQNNPAWVPESNIQRKADYAAAVSEFKYKPSKGDFSFVRPLQAPQTAKQGGTADVKARFVVLTPDGGEAKVKIARKLFVIAEGKEEEVPFPGKPDEERVFGNGEQVESINLPVYKEVPVGSKIRIEYAVSLKDAQASSQSGTIEVR